MKSRERAYAWMWSALIALAACRGETGPVGPSGPSLPVIQSLSAVGLPAAPQGSVTIHASAASSDDAALSFAWSVEPAGWSIAAGATSDTVTITAPSTHGALGTATVTVTDASQRTAVGLVTLVTTGNGVPIVQTLSAAPNPARKGETMILSASSIDPEGEPLSYEWTVPSGFEIVSGQGTATALVRPVHFASGTVSVVVSDPSTSTVGSLFVSTFESEWSAPDRIEDGTENADGARVAIDPAGNAIVVYYQRMSSRADIWARRHSVTSGWEPATLLEQDDTGDAFSPEIAVDSSGNAMVVWYQWDGERFDIWSRRYTVGSGWDAEATLVETNDSGTAYGVRVGVDDLGHAVAVWQQQAAADRYDVWANVYVHGTGWGEPARLETDDAGSAQLPELAMNRSGDAFVVWQQSDGTRENVWSNRFTLETGWEGPVLLELENLGPAWFPDVAVDATGRAIAVWEQTDGATMRIRANRYVPGAEWSGATIVDATDTLASRFPKIAMNDAGDALIVWSRNQGIWHDVATFFRVGSGFEIPSQIESAETGENYGGVRPAIDAHGNGFAVWNHEIDTRREIWTNRCNVGFTWQNPQRLDRGTGDASFADIAMNASGDGMIAFAAKDSTHYRMWASPLE